MTTVKITTGVGSSHYTFSSGARGPIGPNIITTSTSTGFDGYIYGDGTNVTGATLGATDATSNTIAVRDIAGNITANAVIFPDGGAAGTIAVADLSGARTYTLPDESGYVTLTRNLNGSNDNTQIFARASEAVIAGDAVYISGATGSVKIISKAIANNDIFPGQTIGIALQDIAKNQSGYIVTEGDLENLSIDLGGGNGVSEGDPIYLSDFIPGKLLFGISSKPQAPSHLVNMGVVTKMVGNAVTQIYVKVRNGYYIEELYNVAISDPQNNQLLKYNSASEVWNNTDDDSVKLSGVQTINGSKTFTGQIRVINQQLSAVSSVLTRETGDARYGTYSDILDADLAVIASTTLVPVVSITLPIGLYQIDAFLSSQHNSAGGCKIRFNSSIGAVATSIKVGLNDSYSRPLLASPIYPLSSSVYNNTNANATRSDSGANEFRRSLTGIVEILTDGTKLTLEYAQQSSNAAASKARARSHIIARRIN